MQTGLIVSLIAALLIIVVSSLTVSYLHSIKDTCPEKTPGQHKFLMGINITAIVLSTLLFVMTILGLASKKGYLGSRASALAARYGGAL